MLNRVAAAALPLLPKAFIRPFARPYVAGESVSEVVDATAALNRDGFRVAISQLGEFVTRREDAEAAAVIYEQVLDEVAAKSLDAYVHVKPTHLGLMVDPRFCRSLIERLLRRARERGGTFLRMDMEDVPQIEPTLALHRDLRAEHPDFGVVLQARIRRSLRDARELAAMKANVRVCKGVYLAPHEVAYQEPDLIRENYVALLRVLLEAGCYVGVATHDEWLIWRAERIIEELGIGTDAYEFQMLHGVRPRLRAMVREAGHPLRVAVPFGPDWLPYSLRRLRRNPDLFGHVFRAVWSKG